MRECSTHSPQGAHNTLGIPYLLSTLCFHSKYICFFRVPGAGERAPFFPGLRRGAQCHFSFGLDLLGGLALYASHFCVYSLFLPVPLLLP